MSTFGSITFTQPPQLLCQLFHDTSPPSDADIISGGSLWRRRRKTEARAYSRGFAVILARGCDVCRSSVTRQTDRRLPPTAERDTRISFRCKLVEERHSAAASGQVRSENSEGGNERMTATSEIEVAHSLMASRAGRKKYCSILQASRFSLTTLQL